MTTGIRVGLIAAATTAGVLVGLGLRHESAMTPFLLYGRAMLAVLTGLLAPPLVATAAGVVGHVFWMLLWGVAFTLVAHDLRGVALAVAAIVCTVIVGWLSSTIAPSAMGAGSLATFTRAQSAFFLVLLGASLFAGVRLSQAELS